MKSENEIIAIENLIEELNDKADDLQFMYNQKGTPYYNYHEVLLEIDGINIDIDELEAELTKEGK